MWDMRRLAKPVFKVRWDGKSAELEDYYVNPTINTVKFANVSGTHPDGRPSDFIIAGCRDEDKNLPVRCFSTKTGEIVHNFKYV
jgi:hypothetical protein